MNPQCAQIQFALQLNCLFVLLLISNVQILQLWLLATMELRLKILSHPDWVSAPSWTQWGTNITRIRAGWKRSCDTPAWLPYTGSQSSLLFVGLPSEMSPLAYRATFYICVSFQHFSCLQFRCLLLIVAPEGAAAVIWLHWRWRLLVPDHSCCSFLPRAAWLGQKLQFKVPVAARKHWNSLPSRHITEKNRPLLLLLETFC